MKPTWVALVALVFALGYYSLNRAVILHYNREMPPAAPGAAPGGWLPQNRGGAGAGVPGHAVTAGLNGRATIAFPDDEYYLTPPENWLAGKGWRRSPGIGNGSLVRRTPGYSLWYLAHRVVFGPRYVFAALAVTQLLLHLLSALALWRSLLYLRLRAGLVTALVLVFTATPFFNSFTFYSITESLVVPVLVFLMYCLLRGYYCPDPARKRNAYLAAGALWGIALLTRPFTGVCVASLVWVLYYDYVRQGHNWWLFWRRGVQVAVLPLAMLSTWTVRNYVATGGEVVVLEQYSNPETYDVFKPAFGAIFALYMSAGVNQGDFNSYVQPLFSDVTQTGKRQPQFVEGIVQTMPAAMRGYVGEQRLRNAVNQYQDMLLREYHPYVRQDRAMPSAYSPAELAVVDTFTVLRRHLLATHPAAYFTGPLNVVKEVVFHSNTSSMYAFQEPFRSAFPLINLPRYFFLLLHVGLYAALFLGIGWLGLGRHGWGPWPVALAAPPLLLILLLALTRMTTEQRYLLVFLEYLVLFAGLVAEQFLSRWAGFRRKRAMSKA